MRQNFVKRSVVISLCAVGVFGLGIRSASALNARSWVSGVGMDSNPCTRTAPCQTFATAITNTSAGGEVNILDAGGFANGSLSITKSITIQAIGVEAGVFAGLFADGIDIAAGVNDQVNLIGLDLDGLGVATDGVKITGGASIHIHNCSFRHWTSAAVHVLPNSGQAGASYVLVTDTIFDQNVIGVAVASSTATAAATVKLDRVTIMGPYPTSSVGIWVDGSAASVVLNNSSVVRNETGLRETNGGQLFSHGNNSIVENGSNGAPTGVLSLQ